MVEQYGSGNAGDNDYVKKDYSPSKSGVEKYLSAVSGKTVITRLPFPSFRASLIAAATLVPLEIPHMMPSFAASSFDVRRASSSDIMQI